MRSNSASACGHGDPSGCGNRRLIDCNFSHMEDDFQAGLTTSGAAKTDSPELVLRQIIAFLEQIGLKVQRQELPDDTFLPGISSLGSDLLIDPEKLKYPGDLLHEAGHLAVLPPAQRAASDGDFATSGGAEMAAIAWSYAACMHLGLPLDVLFHQDGYKGDAAWLRETFAAGNYIGLPILVWRNMTSADGEGAYPEMERWLCSEDSTD